MRKLLLLSTLLAATWALAQSDQSSTSQMGQSKSANQVSIQGCLSGSNGNYTITDQAGKTYQLTGTSADLASHVGQQVQISGSSTPAAGGTSGTAGTSGSTGGTGTTGTAGGGTSSTSQPSQLSVESVSKVSDTCSTAR